MALLTNINGKFSVSDAGAVTFNNAFTFPTADGAANYVLQTNGSGQLAWALNGNGDISGSGTANTVTKFTGSKTIGNGPITFSGDNSTFAGSATATGVYTAGNSAIIYKAQRTGGAVAGDWSYDDATTDMSLGTSTAHSFSLKTGNTKALTINNSQNATFIGDVSLANLKSIYLGTSSALRIYTDSAVGYLRGNDVRLTNAANDSIIRVNGDVAELYHNDIKKLETTSTGVTVTNTVAATTFSGDLNGTINTVTTAATKGNSTNDTTVATTAFVQNVVGTIPAGLVFQGTWNANTNTPTLTSGSGTTGNFYIVSVAGSTNLDGITDWQVGDWAVFIEQGASDQWEKIDNSSVLGGSGTGGSFAGWSGSGTSVTLGNAPVTFSGNNSTFAGNIILGDTPQIRLGTNNDAQIDHTGSHLFIDNSVGNSYLRNTSTGSIILRNSTGGDIQFDNEFAGNILFNTSNIERLRINSSGDSTFNSQNLDVKGPNAGNTQIRITDSTGTAGTNSFDLINDGTAAYVWNRKQTDLNFATYGSLRMKIRASGTVGIGANGGYDSQMLSIDAGVLDGAIYATSSDANCFASFRDGNSTANIEYGAIGNAHVFRKDATEYMRIDSSGNVGIGNDSPDTKLMVSGEILSENSNGGYFVSTRVPSSSSRPTLNFYGTALDINYVTGYAGSGASTAVSILTNGNVGIGTTSPDQTGYGYKTLTIMGGTTAGYAGVLELLTPSTNANGQNLGIVSFGSGGTRNALIGAVRQSGNNNAKLQFWTAAGANGVENRMTIDADGKVGIGTDSPGAKLEVVEATANTDVILRLKATRDAYLQFAPANTVKWGLIADYPDLGDFTTYNYPNNFNAIICKDNKDITTNLSGGNFGIGTTSPAQKLDVVGKMKISDDIILAQTNGRIDYDNGVSSGALRFHSTSGNAERMRITSAGNVGIGTADGPGDVNAKLHVYKQAGDNTVNELLRLDCGENNHNVGKGGAIVFRDINVYTDTAKIIAQRIGNTGGSTLQFSLRGGEKMRIKSDGNVGIGTTSPTYKLHVASSNNVSIFEDTSNASGAAFIVFNRPGVFSMGSITRNGSANSVSYNTGSDYRLKEDLKDFNALDLVNNITAYDYKWKDIEQRDYGFIAHELKQTLPNVVTGEKDGEKMQGVDYSKLTPILLKAIQELEARVKELENK